MRSLRCHQRKGEEAICVRAQQHDDFGNRHRSQFNYDHLFKAGSILRVALPERVCSKADTGAERWSGMTVVITFRRSKHDSMRR